MLLYLEKSRIETRYLYQICPGSFRWPSWLLRIVIGKHKVWSFMPAGTRTVQFRALVVTKDSQLNSQGWEPTEKEDEIIRISSRICHSS